MITALLMAALFWFGYQLAGTAIAAYELRKAINDERRSIQGYRDSLGRNNLMGGQHN